MQSVRKNGHDYMDFALLVVYTASFLCRGTLVMKYAAPILTAIEIGVGGLLLLSLGWRIVAASQRQRGDWGKRNLWVFLYGLLRIVSFVLNDRDPEILVSLCFEMVYLVGISSALRRNVDWLPVLLWMVVVWSLVVNLVDIGLYHLMDRESVYIFCRQYTYFGNENPMEFAPLYLNTNYMGMMTGLAMVAGGMLFFRGQTSRIRTVFFLVFEAFSAYALWVSQCRSAQVGLAVAVVIFLVVALGRRIPGRWVAAAGLVLMALVTLGIVGYVWQHADTEIVHYTEQETRINDLSTGRYTLWKAGYLTHDSAADLLVGGGTVEREQVERDDWLLTYYTEEPGYGAEYFWSRQLNAHNGYLEIIFVCGWPAFFLFMTGMLVRIRRASLLDEPAACAALWYVLVVNLFECMLAIGVRFCVPLFFFILLTEDARDA